MVRILVEDLFTPEGSRYIEAAGLSTDDKPEDNIVTGSKFTEVDTSDEYRFNEAGNAGSKWVKSNPGGGGGGTTGGALMVQVTTEDNVIYTFDKTANEILAAFVAGQAIIVHFPDGMYSIDDYSTVIGIHTMLNGEDKQYYVRVFWGGNMEDFVCYSADGYPEKSFA